MNKIMQEGGLADDGMTHEPVTGNAIPPGSLASEVRDDIDVKLSEGEYVVPADVLRYYGVRFFEDLRAQAKQGMAEMDSDGRIGGTAVTEEGVPAENVEEELTPEEEQMLAEALGMANGGMVTLPANPYPLRDTSAPLKMAEGGVVGEPFFDRTQFQLNTPKGAFEDRKYINTTTGEEKTLKFLNGMPMGAVPEGFVPWTPELASQVEQNKATSTPAVPTPEVSPVKVDRGGRDPQESGATTGGTGEGSSGYQGWADKNFDAISSDPYSFGVDALSSENKSSLGKKAAGIAGAVIGGSVGAVVAGVGLAGKAVSNINAVAEAKAALEVMSEKGLKGTTQYTDLEKRVQEAISGLPTAQQIAVETEVVATGKKYAKPIIERLKNPKSKTTTTPTESDLGTSSTSRGVSYTSDANSKGEYSKAVATGSTAPTTSPRPQSRPASSAGGVKGGSGGGQSKGSAGSSSSGGRAESRRAKGGLVTKEQSKAKKSDRGLASKTKS